VIFCHIKLERSELLAFVYIFVECTLPRQSPIANRVLHKRQRKLIDIIDRHVMIFLTTYFRTTPMADVNFTSHVACHNASPPAIGVILHEEVCQLLLVKTRRVIIYVINNVPSLRFVYGRFGDLHSTAYLYVTSGDDADNATCKSRVGLPYSVLPVAERTIFGFGCERTRGS